MNRSARPGAVVLVDTNVIIEAHRSGTWAALVGAYRVETVEDCVTETQTGYERRPREQWIDVGELKASLGGVHDRNSRFRRLFILGFWHTKLAASLMSPWPW